MDGKVANPPARTLRFDGHEIILGEADSPVFDTDQLVGKLQQLVSDNRYHTAATLVARHRESAERLLAERWAGAAEEEVVRLVAAVLSRRCTQADANWSSLLELARTQGGPASHYQQLRNAFAEELQTNDPSGGAAEALLQASAKVAHPLVRVDALRLLGLRDLVAGRHAWAESHFRQAIEMAASSGNELMAAELWLMVAETARRGNQLSAASTAWSKATSQHLAAFRGDQPLDVSFWIMADKTRQEPQTWPAELRTAFAANVQRVGCTPQGGSEMVLWICVAQAQLERGEFQSALVNFKRAETLAEGTNGMWLRIAQARCLAAMGQSPAASAILSGPAASADAAVSAAATAAMGSIKLKSGAYQQGAQLLHKATSQSPLINWPMKNQALADLALAQLIIGDTDEGLAALHRAQALLEQAGQRDLLIQSLDNELRLLEFEQRSPESVAVKRRLSQLERL